MATPKTVPLETTNDDESSNPFFNGFTANGKIGKAFAAFSAARMVWSTAKSAHNYIRSKRELTITISSKDPIYSTVLEWLARDSFGHQAKDIALVTTLRRNSDEYTGEDYSNLDDLLESSSEEDTSYELKSIHNTHTRQHIMVGKHKIQVMLEDPSQGGAKPNTNVSYLASKIVFFMHSREAFNELSDQLQELHKLRVGKSTPPTLWVPNGWGGFSSRGAMPDRDIDSVILKDGELESIKFDLESFLASETKYNKLGIPWHRGYLFYGVPGTGKTSLGKALARHFGLDVFYLPLGDLKEDSALDKMTEALRPKSILLLEDVDVFAAARSRDAGNQEVSLSGLLNLLDGVTTPHGMITIITTNNVERLDDALVRPGRVDFKLELSALDQLQGDRMFDTFYKRHPSGMCYDSLVPADLIAVFKNNFDNYEAAVIGCKELVEERQCALR